ncbi:unnamed protein product [Polarella glacialis]|uniref:Uncharacterized protein n=1 Tax=Polarella glacialis TaxID=89957 RepID=A0A813I563_POLGL|nr:unnamed protein product [Polarella glacialis]CAE8604491.1 unnamed protein product [Polarella glacialis]CAE8644900.1 unnamed protein product [Polarella glacialis]
MPSGSVSPSFEEWWKVAPKILHDADWTLEFENEDGKLSHHSSQWGGQWMRIDAVLDVPLDPNAAMIRPEVKAKFNHLAPSIERGVYLNVLVQTLGVGDAVLKRWVDNKFWKATRFLLTDDLVAPEPLTGALSDQEFENVPHLARVTLRRDWPQLGQAGMMVTPHEPEDDKDDELIGRSMAFLCAFWKNPEDASKLCGVVLLHLTSKKFSVLAKQHFGLLTRVAADFGKSCVTTDQGGQELREIDLNFYVVIGIKKCQRGPPLLPSQMLREGTVRVAAGDHLGLGMWERWDEERFTLPEYLRSFIFSLLGQPEVEVYDALDGRQLVPYQAAVPRELWTSIKPALMTAFAIQKAAYRHVQGGSCAPALCDDTAARFLPSGDASFSDEESIRKSKGPVKIDVRNRGGEGEGDKDSDEEVSRPIQRKKSSKIGQLWRANESEFVLERNRS